jgi:hypothetical protein
MMFLRKNYDNDEIFAFPSKEEKCQVQEEQTVEKLQVPIIDQRNKYHFCDPIIKAE